MSRGSPALSVVVAAPRGPDSARVALDSLARQEDLEGVEVLLADGGGAAAPAPSGPVGLRHLRLGTTLLPALKGEAVRAARGELVAFLDPHDAAAPAWTRAIRSCLAGAPAAVAAGGSVEPGGAGSGADRAAWLFEYGAFAPPLVPGPTRGDLPGNNVAYRRRALVETCGDLLLEGFWKPFLHQRLREAGGELHLCPAMEVRHETAHRLGPFLRSRFHYGRCFGAMRLRHVGAARRALYRAAAPLVGPLLVQRHLRRALAHPGTRPRLWRALPALLAICLGWGLGEWLGCWFGAGGSCRRVS